MLRLYYALEGEDLNRASEEALNQLITRQLILQAASQQGFMLDEETIQKRVKLLFGTYGDEALDAALAQANITREELVWWVSELTTVEMFTTDVIMYEADDPQGVYNEWLNQQQANAKITMFTTDQATNLAALPGSQAPNFTLTTLEGANDFFNRLSRANCFSEFLGHLVPVLYCRNARL